MSLVKSEEFTEYGEVVFYRRGWFWGLSILLCTPLGLLIGLSGNVYRYKGGEVLVQTRGYRIAINILFIVLILTRFMKPIYLALGGRLP